MSNVVSWVFLKSVIFVTSTFSKARTCYISLMFVMDVMIFHYVESRKQISK